MIINLYSSLPNSPSWIFYKELFSKFKKFSDISINFIENHRNLNSYNNFKESIALVFGNIKTKDFENIKKRNLLIGRLEPRAASKINFKKYDFIINNSLESQDYFSYSNLDSHILPTFPRYTNRRFQKVQNTNCLVLGYHGNCFHISALLNKIYKELSNYSLNQNKKIILKIMSNKKIFKRNFPIWYFKNIKMSNNSSNLRFKFFDYDKFFMSEFMSNIDIGLCPQLVPIQNNFITKKISSTIKNKFNERNSDLIMRYKETSNIGRLAVFSQFKIPVISDPCPSSCSVIGMNEFGIIASSKYQWIKSIKYLENKDIRYKLGSSLSKRINDLYSDEIMCKNFLKFLDKLITKISY